LNMRKPPRILCELCASAVSLSLLHSQVTRDSALQLFCIRIKCRCMGVKLSRMAVKLCRMRVKLRRMGVNPSRIGVERRRIGVEL